MKRAFTLIELIVYMALLGFVIIVAGRVFSDSTVMRVRSQNMIRTAEAVGNVSNLIKEDLSQMGVKAWGQNVNGEYQVFSVATKENQNSKVYWSASSANGDSSSYALKHTKVSDTVFFDSIVFRKAAFDSNGVFLGIREIAWAARQNTRQLVRRCATLPNRVCPAGINCNNANDPDASVCPQANDVNGVAAVTMAENITNFKITPAQPSLAGNAQDTLFGRAADPNFKLFSRTSGTDIPTPQPNKPNIHDYGIETVVSDFALARNEKGEKQHYEFYLSKSTGSTWSDCEPLTLKKGETYAVEFKMPFPEGNIPAADSQVILNSTQFVPGKDHLAIGLRTKSGDPIPNASDILFYPAQSGNADTLKRHLEFSVKDSLAACVAITMAYYSPETTTDSTYFNGSKGMLKFKDFKVFRKADETFSFPNDGDGNYGTEDKTPAAEKIKQKTNAKAFELMLEIENRGEKAGTYSSAGKKGMVITTPNNGVIPQN